MQKIRLVMLTIAATFLVSWNAGCGPNEVAVPEQTPDQQQKMLEYNKAVNAAEKKGIDPSTIPPPK